MPLQNQTANHRISRHQHGHHSYLPISDPISAMVLIFGSWNNLVNCRNLIDTRITLCDTTTTSLKILKTTESNVQHERQVVVEGEEAFPKILPGAVVDDSTVRCLLAMPGKMVDV